LWLGQESHMISLLPDLFNVAKEMDEMLSEIETFVISDSIQNVVDRFNEITREFDND